MGLDINKIKDRLGKLKNNGKEGNKSFWRPSIGSETTIRIVPTSDGDPFRDFYFHYNVGKDNSGFLCPKKNFGDDCPVCELATKLFREGDEGSIREAKTLFTRQRFFAPVLVRGEEDEGVRIWGFGKTAYETLLRLVLNPEYGDITDVEDGTDLVIAYDKPPGASFPQTKITPRRRNSPLCEEMDPKQCAELLENIPDFNGLFERKSTQYVASMLDQYLLEDEPEENSSQVEKYSANSTNSANSTKEKTETKSVDAAFEELMGA